MNKIKTNKIKKFSPKAFIKNLLYEAGIPKTKDFSVRNKDGKLVVRFNKKEYE